MENQIEVIIVKPNEEPCVTLIDSDYETKKDIVDVLIEFMNPVNKLPNHIDLIVNEEYLLNGSRWNAEVIYYGESTPINGTMMFVGVNNENGETTSIDKDYINYISEMFSLEKRNIAKIDRIWKIMANYFLKDDKSNLALLLSAETFEYLKQTFSVDPKDLYEILDKSDITMKGYKQNSILPLIKLSEDYIALRFDPVSLIYYAIEVGNEEFTNMMLEEADQDGSITKAMADYGTYLGFEHEIVTKIDGLSNEEEKTSLINDYIEDIRKGNTKLKKVDPRLADECINYLEERSFELKHSIEINKKKQLSTPTIKI